MAIFEFDTGSLRTRWWVGEGSVYILQNTNGSEKKKMSIVVNHSQLNRKKAKSTQGHIIRALNCMITRSQQLVCDRYSDEKLVYGIVTGWHFSELHVHKHALAHPELYNTIVLWSQNYIWLSLLYNVICFCTALKLVCYRLACSVNWRRTRQFELCFVSTSVWPLVEHPNNTIIIASRQKDHSSFPIVAFVNRSNHIATPQ